LYPDSLAKNTFAIKFSTLA